MQQHMYRSCMAVHGCQMQWCRSMVHGVGYHTVLQEEDINV